MNRRAFLGLSLVGLPLAAEAQQPGNVRRIGLLGTIRAEHLDTFRAALRDLGWIEGQNLGIERRASGPGGSLGDQAADLSRLGVDVIVAPGPVAVDAARSATATIPIIMVAGTDPVAAGWVTSLARPSGNVTGFTIGASPEIGAKWLELLKEAVPTLTRLAVLMEARVGSEEQAISRPMESAARSLRLQVQPLVVTGPDDFVAAFGEAARRRADALVHVATPMLDVNQDRLIAFTVRHRLPSIGLFAHYATAGGLMAYGPDLSAIFRSVAAYADRILRGAKAADLPVQQPTEVKLVLNRKTAKALKLQIPRSFLARVDQVIE